MKKSLLFAFTFLYALPVQASVQDLIESIKDKDLAKTEILLQSGEDVNAANEQGNTPLHYAVATNNADMARLLLQYGANMNAENMKGWSPLKIAQNKNVEEVTKVLEEALNSSAKEEKPAVKAESVKQAAPTAAQSNITDQELLKRAKAAVEQAQKDKEAALQALKQTEIAQSIAENELEEAQQKIQKMEKRIMDLEENLAIQKKELAQAVAQNKNCIAASVEVKKEAPVKAEPAKKAEPTKKAEPAPKPQPPVKSKLNSALTAGDEEIIYCMNLLGQVENPNMVRAAGFYASNANINHARYNEITSLANAFYSGAKEADLKALNDKCAKVITPTDAKKQNQIIRSLNQARGL